MGYKAHLWRMLEPLGVYRGDGFVGGELAALGAGMDGLQETLTQSLQEMTAVTAEGTGLDLAENLFSMKVAGDTESRRENLKTLHSTDYGSFTETALTDTLAACGIPVALAGMTATFTVAAMLGEPMTMDRDPVWIMETLERVLPCHLAVMVFFTYADADTGETVEEQGELKTLRTWSRSQWEQLLGA